MYFLILPNQLFDIKYLDKDQEYIIWECPHYFKAYNYNKKKLVLHRASMKYYHDYLLAKGYLVSSYYEFDQKPNPRNEYTLFDPLNNIDILDLPPKSTLIASPNILLSSDICSEYHKKTKKFFFNAFYMWSKKKLGIIPDMKSQDKLNRNVMKNNKIVIKQPFKTASSYSSDYIKEAVQYVNKHFQNNHGDTNDIIFPITHKDAKQWLQHFIMHKFEHFGTFQDFIHKDNPWLYHSLLSTLINIGLLCPSDIIEAIRPYEKKIPINSYEGFIRQLFWREYQYYCYKFYDFRNKNYFANKKKLDQRWYKGTLQVQPVDDAIKEAFKYGYLHHIKRLMVIGNYMNLSEIDPKEGFRWFMEFSCDSYEWVMHQNVYDMVFFVSGGSGGATMRRPYVSSSNYILKMSNYKRGEWSDHWDTMYKRFLQKNKKKLWKYRYYFANLKDT